MSKRWRTAQKFELKWWENYLANKPVSEYLDWKKKYWIALLQQLLPEFRLYKDQKVLDAGCGPAGIFIALPDQQVTAIDPLIHNYASSLAHYDQATYPYVNFIETRMEEFTHAAIFDVVFCMNAINHVADINLSMKAICNSLKPNGYFIMSIDAHNYSLAKSIFRAIPGDILHPHQYDIREYAAMIKAQGMLIEKRVLLKQEFLFNHYLILAKKK